MRELIDLVLRKVKAVQTGETQNKEAAAWVQLGDRAVDNTIAESNYQKALCIDPQNKLATIGLLEIEIRNKKQIATAPDWIELGVNYLHGQDGKSKDLKKAQLCFCQALELDDNNKNAILGLVHITIIEKGWLAGDGQSWYIVGVFHSTRNLCEQDKLIAEICLNQILKLNPKNGELVNRALSALLGLEASKEQGPDVLFQLGKSYALGDGRPLDYQRAIICFQMAYSSDETNLEPLYNLGLIYVSEDTGFKNLGMAKYYYGLILSKKPLDKEVLLAVLEIDIAEQNLNPNDPDSWNNLAIDALGEVEIRNVSQTKAKLCYIEALRCNPHNKRASDGLYLLENNRVENCHMWVEFGKLYFSNVQIRQNYLRARTCFQKAYLLDKKRVEILYHLGLVCESNDPDIRDLKKAKNYYYDILCNQPLHEGALLRLLQIIISERNLSLDDPNSWNDLATAKLIEIGNEKQTCSLKQKLCYCEALKRDPNNDRAILGQLSLAFDEKPSSDDWYKLGVSLYSETVANAHSNYLKARVCFLHVLDLNLEENKIDALCYLGSIYESKISNLRDLTKAKFYYEKILLANPAHEIAHLRLLDIEIEERGLLSSDWGVWMQLGIETRDMTPLCPRNSSKIQMCFKKALDIPLCNRSIIFQELLILELMQLNRCMKKDITGVDWFMLAEQYYQTDYLDYLKAEICYEQVLRSNMNGKVRIDNTSIDIKQCANQALANIQSMGRDPKLLVLKGAYQMALSDFIHNFHGKAKRQALGMLIRDPDDYRLHPLAEADTQLGRIVDFKSYQQVSNYCDAQIKCYGSLYRLVNYQNPRDGNFSFINFFFVALYRHNVDGYRELVGNVYGIVFISSESIILFRRDTRAPSIIFTDGFQLQIDNQPWTQKYLYAELSTGSIGVSTAKNPPPSSFGLGLFKIKLPKNHKLLAVDCNETARKRHQTPRTDVDEVNFMHPISKHLIQNCTFDTNPGAPIVNPDFMESGGGVAPVAGIYGAY